MQAVVLRQPEHRIARSHATKRRLLESRQLFLGNEDPNGARFARNPFDEAARLESEHHVVNGRRRNLKEPLHVSFSRRSAMKKRVHLDESQVLPLKRGELVFVLQPLLLHHRCEGGGTSRIRPLERRLSLSRAWLG